MDTCSCMPAGQQHMHLDRIHSARHAWIGQWFAAPLHGCSRVSALAVGCCCACAAFGRVVNTVREAGSEHWVKQTSGPMVGRSCKTSEIVFILRCDHLMPTLFAAVRAVCISARQPRDAVPCACAWVRRRHGPPDCPVHAAACGAPGVPSQVCHCVPLSPGGPCSGCSHDRTAGQQKHSRE